MNKVDFIVISVLFVVGLTSMFFLGTLVPSAFGILFNEPTEGNIGTDLSDASIIYINEKVDGEVCLYNHNKIWTASLSGNTESMLPTFSVKDIMFLIKNFTDEDIKVGNIVVFNSTFYPTQTLIHRIVKIDGEKIYTKGDNNKDIDEGYITKDQITDLYVGHVPR